MQGRQSSQYTSSDPLLYAHTLFNRSGSFLFKLLFFLFRSWEAWLGMAGQDVTLPIMSTPKSDCICASKALHLPWSSYNLQQGLPGKAAHVCARLCRNVCVCVCMLLFMGGAFVYASWTYARQIIRLTAAYDLKQILIPKNRRRKKVLMLNTIHWINLKGKNKQSFITT